MQISELRHEARSRLLRFAWDEWAQMGVSASSSRRDDWAMDPEALLLFTFEIGRADARLFDEVTDWMVRNEDLISTRRLRNMCRDETDRALVDAFLASLARLRPGPSRSVSDPEPQLDPTRGEPFFRDLSIPIRRRAEAGFLQQGWLKAQVEPSGKSQAPDLLAPVNFAFRLRHILGIGARAEVMRTLLTINGPHITTQAIADSAGYAKRNVHEALSSLHAARVIESVPVGNELRYRAEPDGWAGMLGLKTEQMPRYRDWPRLLYGLRRLTRWLEDERLDRASEYMLASRARDVGDAVAPELRLAGVPLGLTDREGSGYWEDFTHLTRAAMAAVG